MSAAVDDLHKAVRESSRAKHPFDSCGTIDGANRCMHTERPLTHLSDLPGRQAAMQRTCSIDGCGKPHQARGLCNTHYWRRWISDPDFVPPRMSREERFWSKVDKTAGEGCWLWTAAKTPNGYGKVQWKGVTRGAHRVAYLLLVGTIPDGLHLDHVCRVRHCVNPAHLEPVTCRENMMRSPAAPSTLNANKTHCPKGHPYDEANTLYQSRGKRACRSCLREQCRRWRERLRAEAVE